MQCSGVAEEVVGAGQPLRCVSTGACPPTSLPAYPSTRLSCLYCSPNDGGDGRAVLSLDDDILIPCNDVEAAFAAWRAAPEALVGFYPRLLLPDGSREYGPPVHRPEPFVFEQVQGCTECVCVVGW